MLAALTDRDEMATILDVIDNFTGDTLSAESFYSWACDSQERLSELMEEIHKFLDSVDFREQSFDNLDYPIGIDLNVKWFNPQKLPAVVQTTKALLLYYPCVALEFPRIHGEPHPDLVMNILRPYIEMRPLVEKHVVLTWKPSLVRHDEATLVTSFLRQEESFLSTVESVRDILFTETALKWFTDLKGASADILAMHYVYWMLLRFGQCSASGISAVPQGLSEWKTLKQAFDTLSHQSTQSKDIDFSFTAVSQYVELPSASSLGLKDIASIRDSEECFAVWRSCIRETVYRINTSDGPLPTDFGRELKEILLARAMQIKEATSKGVLKQKLLTGATTFTLSAATIATSLGIGIGNPIEEYTKLGISAIIGAVATLLSGGAPKPNKALLRHIAAFTECDFKQTTRRCT